MKDIKKGFYNKRKTKETVSLFLSTARNQGTKDMEKAEIVGGFLPFLLLKTAFRPLTPFNLVAESGGVAAIPTAELDTIREHSSTVDIHKPDGLDGMSLGAPGE